MYPQKFQARFVVYRNQRGEYLMATGEARTAKWLDLIGLDWAYNNRSINVGHNITYVPDFYLPELKLYIEVKNKEPKFTEPYEYEKIRLFHEMGNDVYIMRRPPIQVNFCQDDFVDSNGAFYSSKFITEPFDKGKAPRLMTLKPSAATGRPELAELHEFDGLYYVQEASEANNYIFPVAHRGGDDWID